MRHRSDSNQKQVVKALERCGGFVVNLSQAGDGCPDLLVYLNGWHLLEAKTDGPWKYTPAQKKFRKRCPVSIPVVTSPQEAVTWAKNVIPRKIEDISYEITFAGD